MTPCLYSLEVATPDLAQTQPEILNRVLAALDADDPARRAVQRIYRGAKIETRHSVVEDFANDTLAGTFFGSDFPSSAPGMSRRNAVYKQEAPALAHKAAEKALDAWSGSRESITHVISVSCTGLIAPGLEFHLVNSLGLNRSVQRLGISFMGCFGAFKGLAIARALAMEDPSHRVLVVCTELCSLHFQLDGRLDTHVANALFSDGAAAVVVGCGPTPAERPIFELIRNASMALEDSLELMTWEAEDRGLVMRLSNKVPALLKQSVRPFAESLLQEGQAFADCSWALHPGGKAILKAIEERCALEPEQTAASWEILRDYGNMSSATFLFVLDRQRRSAQRAYTLGLGFGPGLSIEGILLRSCPT